MKPSPCSPRQVIGILCAPRFNILIHDNSCNCCCTDPCSKLFRFLRGGLYAMLGLLNRVPISSYPHKSPIPMEKKETQRGRLKDGDRALKALGIPTADYVVSLRALAMLFAGHMLLAFLGLIASRPSG